MDVNQMLVIDTGRVGDVRSGYSHGSPISTMSLIPLPIGRFGSLQYPQEKQANPWGQMSMKPLF